MTTRVNLAVNPIGPGGHSANGWTASAGTLATQHGYLRVTVTSSGATNMLQRIEPTGVNNVALMLPVAPNSAYTLQAEARSSKSFPMRMSIQFHDAAGVAIASSAVFSTAVGTDPTTFTTLPALRATSPANAAFVMYRIGIADTIAREVGDTFDVRKVFLEQADHDTTIGPTNYARDPQLTADGSSNNSAHWAVPTRVTDQVPPGTSNAMRTTRLSAAVKTNLVPDPQLKTAAASNNSATWTTPTFDTTVAAPGTTSSFRTTCAGTTGTRMASTNWGGLTNTHPLRIQVTAGQRYSVSVYVRTDLAAGGTAQLNVLWRNAADANFSTSTGVVSATFPANTWTRITNDNLLAPAGAVYCVPYVDLFSVANPAPPGTQVWVGAAQVTLSSTTESYFDGATADTAGHDYAWTGTANASTSTDSPTAGYPVPANAVTPAVIASVYVSHPIFNNDRRIRVIPGSAVSASVWVRTDAANAKVGIFLVFRTSAGTATSPGQVNGPTIDIEPNVWTEVRQENAVVPAGAEHLYPILTVSTRDSTPSLVGAQSWFGKVHVTRDAAILGYGDGDTAGWGWAGTPHGSESFRYTTVRYFDGDTESTVDLDYTWTGPNNGSTSLETLVPLRNYNFQLGGTIFGLRQPVTVEVFDPGSVDWRTQDAENPVRAGRMFGRDYLSATTWTFEMSTDQTDETTALDTLAELGKAWRGVGVADTPGKVMPLTYRLADRRRRVYGRPRQWAAPPDNRMMTGYIPITADFALVDPLHYDDDEHSATVAIVPASAAGFLVPEGGFEAPITTLTGGFRDTFITVGGDAATWPVIRIDGPITNPWVSVQGWKYELRLTLESGQYVVIDTRPWALTVMRSGVGSVAGSATASSRLDRMKLDPGDAEILFGGIDATGTARCSISWRNAWHSL